MTDPTRRPLLEQEEPKHAGRTWLVAVGADAHVLLEGVLRHAAEDGALGWRER